MRRFCACVMTLVSCIAATAMLTGCHREPEAAPVAKDTPRGRSTFYSQLSDPKSNTLKTGFEKKFPAQKFQVVVLGPMTVTSPEGQVSHQVEVQVVVKDANPTYEADHPLVLNECENLLRELLSSSGMELNGSVQETKKDEKKDGFWFGYKSATHSGTVRVDPSVARSLMIVVRERE
jgi:hypothetical protein